MILNALPLPISKMHETLKQQEIKVVTVDYTTVIIWGEMVGAENREKKEREGGTLIAKDYKEKK